jgi:hypothetical protein
VSDDRPIRIGQLEEEDEELKSSGGSSGRSLKPRRNESAKLSAIVMLRHAAVSRWGWSGGSLFEMPVGMPSG